MVAFAAVWIAMVSPRPSDGRNNGVDRSGFTRHLQALHHDSHGSVYERKRYSVRLRRSATPNTTGPARTRSLVPEFVADEPHHDSSAGSGACAGGFPASCRCLISEYSAGITTRVSTVEETMPPTIGAAMRRMTSDPVPVLHMIGSRPAMIA